MRLRNALAAALLLTTPALGASLSDILAEISGQLPSGSQITAAQLRGVLNDMATFSATPPPGVAYANIPDLACGSDMSATIQAQLNALPRGGLLILPGGCILVGATPIVTLDGQHIAGVGPHGAIDTAGTQLKSNSLSGSILTLNGNGASISDLWFSNAQASTTAAAIQLGVGDSSNPAFQAVRRVRVEGFGKGILFSDGHYQTIDNFMADGTKVAGIHINNVFNGDLGDSSLSNIYLSSNPTGILFSTGGGPKITNLKINGGTVGIDIAPPDLGGTFNGTSDFKIGNSSIEGTTVAGVRVKCTGTTGYIYGVTIDAQIAPTSGDGVVLGCGAEDVIIPPSALIGTSGHAVSISGGNTVRGTNATIAPTVNGSGLSAFYITAGDNYNFDTRNVANVSNGIIFEDARGSAYIGNETSILKKTLNMTGMSTSYKTIFTIKPPDYSGGFFTFSFQGLSNSVGPAAYVARKGYIHGSAAASTVSTGSVDDQAVNIIDFNYDTSNADGSINIQARLHAGGTSVPAGTATISVEGRAAIFSYNTAF